MAQGKKKIKVFVGISGGVDSSVSALLLKNQGYEVVGVYMKNWSDNKNLKTGRCTWQDDRLDAIKICAELNIPFLTLDFERQYTKEVIGYLFREYQKGRTPNPDILCNKKIKFDLFLRECQKLGADFIATGHYAKKNIKKESGKINYQLKIPKDKHKDQTYFLYTLNQKQLAKVLFPLSNFTKPEVREIARKNNLITANKKDSQGICFVGQVPIAKFLSKKLKPKMGNVLDSKGKIIGTHQGAYFYTLGQRHGFSVSVKRTNSAPYYISQIDTKKNTLTAVSGNKNKLLYSQSLITDKIHWISRILPTFPLFCQARIRHGQFLQKVEVLPFKGERVKVNFFKKQRAICQGQSIVFYQKGIVLGGGIIEKALSD